MKTANSGFTVIEVMIAVLLLSFTALTYLYAMNQGHKVAGSLTKEQIKDLEKKGNVIW